MELPETIDSFRVLRLLGSGGMGQVFLAVDPRLERQVAIKRLIHTGTTSPGIQERFRREAKLLARMNHPAIVQIYGVVEHEGSECIVMEYVDGKDLRQVTKGKPLSVQEFLPIALQIAEGMAEAHAHGIIHRDLKTENILYAGSGRVKITDFGIAKASHGDTLTMQGAIVGTCRTMSPEQALGHPVDLRTDLFSFGVLMYEVLTGKSPFLAETQFSTMQRIVHEKPGPIASLLPDIPPELAALIHQLLHKEPTRRPRDFHDVAESLLSLIRDSGKALNVTADHSVAPARVRGDASPMLSDVEEPRKPVKPPDIKSLGEAYTVQLGRMPPVTEKLKNDHDPSRVSSGGAMNARGVGHADVADADAGAPYRKPGSRPRRWPRPLIATAALLVLGAALLIARLALSPGPGPSAIRVVVLEPRFDSTSHKNAEYIARSGHGILRNQVMALDGVTLISSFEVQERFEPLGIEKPDHEQLMKGLDVDEVLSSRLTCTSSVACELDIERLGNKSELLAHDVVPFHTDDRRSIGTQLARGVRALYPDREPMDSAPLVQQPDYTELERLRNAYRSQQPDMPVDDILRELQSLRRSTDGFMEVYQFEAEVLLHQYFQTQERAYLETARDVADAALSHRPESPLIQLQRFEIMLAAGDREGAESILAIYEQQMPDQGWTLFMQGRLHVSKGDYKQAIKSFEDALERYSSWRTLYWLVTTLLLDNQLGRARERGLQLRQEYPGRRETYAVLGNIYQHRGEWACARDNVELALEGRKTYDECQRLALVYMMLGRNLDAARENYQCALEFRPKKYSVIFDMAEVLKLMGREDEARGQFETLRELLKDAPEEETYRLTMTLAHLAVWDKSLHSRVRELAGRLIARAPPEGKVRSKMLYAASMAFALLGDRESAITAMREVDYPAAWFRFPWFDSLRSDPRVKDRLQFAWPPERCDDGTTP